MIKKSNSLIFTAMLLSLLPDCLYGIVGDVARAGSENTEVNPYALAAAFMTYVGVSIGRGPYKQIGDDWHHTNLFAVHVGRSSLGRKGTAKKLVTRIAKAIAAIDQNIAPKIHAGGLSSTEGLAMMIHDGYKVGAVTTPPIEDKRLLVMESEFANVLHQAARNGNTLSTTLRSAWDGTSIQPAVKNNPVWASNPHIGLMADITPTELLDMMSSRELTNGFANRLLIFWAEGAKVVAFPTSTPQRVVDDLAKRTIAILQFAGADRYVDRDVFQVEFSAEAKKLYECLYMGELRDRSAGERITGLLARRPAVLLRIATLFALTDKTLIINTAHLNAALAWVRYWVDSVKFIFQSAVDEEAAAEVAAISEKMVAYLKEHGKTTRTELTKICFQGHVSRSRIDKAIDELLAVNPPVIEVESIKRPNGKPGSSTKYYQCCANSANSANGETCRPHVPDLGVVRSLRSQRSVAAKDLSDQEVSHKSQMSLA
ncbi:MAG: DUF3987 domain-containing protein [Rhodoferax sp.]|nr:DUF3987 domain-containing protein [Rhodoferax sp.]